MATSTGIHEDGQMKKISKYDISLLKRREKCTPHPNVVLPSLVQRRQKAERPRGIPRGGAPPRRHALPLAEPVAAADADEEADEEERRRGGQIEGCGGGGQQEAAVADVERAGDDVLVVDHVGGHGIYVDRSAQRGTEKIAS